MELGRSGTGITEILPIKREYFRYNLQIYWLFPCHIMTTLSHFLAQSVARLTQEPNVPGSIPDPATYFCFSFR